MNKKGIIISAFPGTGKSYLHHASELDTTDSDSSQFPKAGFPQNYIDDIAQRRQVHDYVLVSSHQEVRKSLSKWFSHFYLVYPKLPENIQYLSSYVARGSTPEFVNLLRENWKPWIISCMADQSNNVIHVQLNPGQHLSDVIPMINNIEDFIQQKMQ